MADRTIKRAKGFAAQTCVLLKGDPAVTLGEAKTFLPLKILSAKTGNTYVATNKTIDARGDADEPDVAKVAIIKKKVVSKKRLAVASDAPDTIAPSSAVPAETESAMENVAEEQRVDTPVDEIIAQIISATTDMETDERESDMVAQSSGTAVVMGETADDFPTLDFQLFISESNQMIETGSDTEDEMESDPEPLRSGKNDDFLGATQSEKSPSTEIADIAPTVDGKTSDEELMSIDDLLATIPNDSTLPSSAGVVTKIQFGKIIEIRGVEEGNWYKTRLPKIPATDKGKAPLSKKDSIKWHPSREIFSLICADIELLIKLREHVIDKVDKFFNSFSFRRLAVLKLEDIYAKEELVLTWAQTDSTKIALQYLAFRSLVKSARQESQNQADITSIELKAVRAQNVVLMTDLADTRKEVQELKAACSNDILDFRAQAQENYNTSPPSSLNSLITLIGVVMTKRGKLAAVDRSLHLMIETEVVLVGLMEGKEEEEVNRQGSDTTAVVDLTKEMLIIG
ncbi:hypothetical protein F511_08949 [Dorcoceras hygrometricum]|uniref:Splicing factor 3B subunit 1-like n=1 Tax=Dorcoceras hygrometricum TaxID=472368 RepID=A0A2Z7CSD2_9LAMI|nr:hypothetical protein F511_08949 [Dorcoceras hygrometricum]